MVNPKFAEALAVIKTAKGTVAVLLSDADSANVSLSILSKLDKAIHQLEFLSGSGVSAAGDAEAFPPVTNFMGEYIVVKEPIEVVVDPTEEERRIFLAKVDNIIDSLLEETLTPGQVVVNSPLPEDELVIRGAAKRAGLEDFDTAEISTAFVDRIKAALVEANEAALQQAEIDAKLANINTVEHEVTQELLDENPQLVEAGVEVGETLVAGATEADDEKMEEVAELQNKSKKGKGK